MNAVLARAGGMVAVVLLLWTALQLNLIDIIYGMMCWSLEIQRL